MNSLFEKYHGLAFGAALAALVTVGLLSYHSTVGLIDAQSHVNHTQQVIDRLDDLIAQAAQAESATRGYVLSGSPFYVEAFRSASAQIDVVLNSLRRLTAGNSRQLEPLSGIQSELKQKLAVQASTIETRRTGGLDAGLKAFLDGRGYIAMDLVRNLAGSMKSEERKLLRERSDRVRAEAERSIWGWLAGSVLSFVVLLTVYYRLTREVRRRKRSEERLVRSNRLYAVLSEVNQAVVRLRDRHEVFQELCRIAVEHGGYGVAWVGLGTPGGVPLTREAAAGLGGEVLAWLDSVLEMPPEPAEVVCNDLSGSACELPWRAGPLSCEFGSAAVLPVTVEEVPVGLFALCAAEINAFDEENLRLLHEVVSDIGFALENLNREALRKKHEVEIECLNQDLEHRVEQRTAELALVNRELAARNQEVERANRLKSEFLATMSHELRTPLNSIIGYAELLARQKPGPLNDKQQRFLGHVDEAARHLLRLINEILDLSKIESGRIELIYEPFDLGESLGEVLSVIKPLAGLKHLELSADVPPGIVIHADRIRFKQVLYNLLSNAVKFTPEAGRVWMECAVEPTGIRMVWQIRA
jgi:CHASE3 domain sensor protein/GAF domain-containing protein